MPNVEFTGPGELRKWKVPKGVKIVDVVLEGAGSGQWRGGRVTGRLRVSDGVTLFIGVGEAGNAQNGKTPGAATWGGGGAGGLGTNGTFVGGHSGGGASFIRYDARNGVIRAVAGGAGGRSGDGAAGGHGGTDRGQSGGLSGGAAGGNRATGGTQSQGGVGGNSTQHRALDGGNGANARLGRGGRGGQAPTTGGIYGGGGGGGGFFPGGGGQGGTGAAASRAGGGGGGSNFTGGLFSATETMGGGDTGNGMVRITWDTPGGDDPPTSPNNLKINGTGIADGKPTKASGFVVLTGEPNDPDAGQDIRLLVRMSTTPNFSGRIQQFSGTFDPNKPETERDQVRITGLRQNTHYYLRVHTQQKSNKKISKTYTSTSFWTNRSPLAPTLLTPAENSQFSELANVTFTWNHNDPDPNDGQSGYRFQYRRAATPTAPAGAWSQAGVTTTQTSRTVAAPAFAANTNYEWQVQTRDSVGLGLWGPWSQTQSFYITGVSTPPVVTSPVKGQAVRQSEDLVFRWKTTAKQVNADIRYRAVGAPDWTVVPGDLVTPGINPRWNMGPEMLSPNFNYEWQVRTHTALGVVSDWSAAGQFWVAYEPGYLTNADFIDSGTPAGGLGQGRNRAYVFTRGGKRYVGEIKNPTMLRWQRTRDDISGALLVLEEWDKEDAALLRGLREWRHEVVIIRTNEDGEQDRVWEGPITRISGNRARLEIEAKDVMAYVYRRIMRQGYSDAYQVINGQVVGGKDVNGEVTGQKTVVQRATQIILNALVYDDPNVIGYLTPMHAPDDARTSRVRRDYSRTAWEEIDDLAATAGLDYVTVGRRIILNDTHRPIGKLPEMGDEHFSEPPLITGYGMSAAVYFAVTDGNGNWGAAMPTGVNTPGPEGWIEQLATAYGEEAVSGGDANLTREQINSMTAKFRTQAQRNIAGRWPVPQIVRVPDNSTLSPALQVGINQLVPGVWTPLRADNGIRSVAQWQKLDSMSVEQTSEDEKISVVMSPAPNGGEDPDADQAVVEEAT